MIIFCAQVEDPLRLYLDPSRHINEYMWHFRSSNFTLRNIWSPFLVSHTVGEGDMFKLYLDKPDMAWARHLKEYDIAVVSTGYWFTKKSMYHVDNAVLGANPQAQLNVTTIHMVPAIKVALENVLKHLAREYNGIVMLRTVTVDHFKDGEWWDGGSCKGSKPFSRQEVEFIQQIPWLNREIHKVQVEEFEEAMAYVNNTARLRLLNVTYSVFLRPDGHPGLHWFNAKDHINDCLHWCLPGPIDVWNQFVLDSMTTAGL
ncbi:hypothetical protein L7F22_007584 [Adiantum nelumboides]|nr:hypothetical protein [Adiantum nelumboides]